MTQYSPFEQEMLTLMKTMQVDVSELKSDVSELKSDVSELKSDVSELKSGMTEVKTRLGSLEETVGDFRDEFRAESANNRILFHQAFTHISDQLAREDDPAFVPRYLKR